MSQFFIKIDNPFSILLDKQYKILRTKHPEIRIILRGSELEVVTNSRVKEEAMLARKGDKDFIEPVEGSWSHKMTWKQKGRTILLEGFGKNYIQDLKQFAN